MKKALILFLIIPCLFSAIAQKSTNILIPYRVGDKWGYSDTSANIVIEAKYNRTFFFGSFNEYIPKLALVRDNQKVGLINTAGEIKIPIEFDDIKVITLSKYRKKIMVAQKNGKWGVINYNNKVLHPFKYNEIKIDYRFYHESNNDSLRFYAVDSLNYFIIGSNKGKKIITKELYEQKSDDMSREFGDQEGDMWCCPDEEKYHDDYFSDSLIKYNIDSTYKPTRGYHRETYIFSKGKIGYYDKRKIFIPPFFDEIIRVDDVVSLVRKDGIVLLIQNNGEVLLELTDFRYYKRKDRYVYLNDRHFEKEGVYDLDSKLLIRPQYDTIADSNCPNYGLIWFVRKNQKEGYVSPSGIEFFRD